MSRGIANANPGNIRRSSTEWLGEAANQTDPDYVQFLQPVYGIRAICKILMSYTARGLCTLTEIIDTWAPPTENDSTAYVEDACERTGFEPSQILDLKNDDEMRAVVKAIIWHENGAQPYDDSTINAAIKMARAA